MSNPYVDTPQQSEANFLAAVKDQYRLIKLVGRGSYGFVYEATALPNNELNIEPGTRLAIKVVRNVLSGYGAINAKRMLREICILRNLDHPNIMKFRGLIAPPNINALKDLYIVCDYVVTDLHKILHSDQVITNKHVQYITYQMLKSVRYLHERDIIHRDIKPANMLIDERVSLKLCDFGLARSTSVKPRLQNLVTKAKGPKLQQRYNKILPKETDSGKPPMPMYNHPGMMNNNNSSSSGHPSMDVHQQQQQQPLPAGVDGLVKAEEPQDTLEKPSLKREYTLHVTTRWYRAPELILQSRTYTTAIDIWSVGCILAELIAMQLNSTHRAALFPGDSCFPLSPMTNKKEPDGTPRRPMNDQMKAILDVIGTPSIEEVKKCYPNNYEEIWAYISSFGYKKRIHYSERYRGADDLALQLLHQLLEFDPEKRLSARQALQHPYLRGIVEELGEHEDIYGTTSKLVDKDGNTLPSPYFDFEEEPINVAMAQALLVEQVLIDNRHRCNDYIVTKEFQQVMEKRELRIREELLALSNNSITLNSNQELELVHVRGMRDVDNNTEQINQFIKQLKNCNRYSFVLFPPHQFRSIAVEVPPEELVQTEVVDDSPNLEWEESTSDNEMNDVTQYDPESDNNTTTTHVASKPVNIFDLPSIPDDANNAPVQKPTTTAAPVTKSASPTIRPPLSRQGSRAIAVPMEPKRGTTWSDLTQAKMAESPVFKAALGNVQNVPTMNIGSSAYASQPHKVNHALPPLPPKATGARATNPGSMGLPPPYAMKPSSSGSSMNAGLPPKGPQPRFVPDDGEKELIKTLVHTSIEKY